MPRSLPRFLYHGTRINNLESVLASGLRPRGEAPSNWKKQPSRPDCVYLSTNQGFAHGKSHDENGRVAVFEVELASLNKRLLYPDEDYVADYLAHQPGSRETYHDLLPQVLSCIGSYKKYWRLSISEMGSVAHRGPIPVQAITRYCTVDFRKRVPLDLTCDGPVSSLFQYQTLERKLTQNTKWFFGDCTEHYEATAIRDVYAIAEGDALAVFERRLKIWLRESADRTGITVVRLR